MVVGIDRLGRNAAEVMTTIRELGQSQLHWRWRRDLNPIPLLGQGVETAVTCEITCYVIR